jgi:hypothetical protein
MCPLGRSRSKRISSTELREKERKEIETLVQGRIIAHDLCSLRALRGAFEASKEDDGYDMGESFLSVYSALEGNARIIMCP